MNSGFDGPRENEGSSNNLEVDGYLSEIVKQENDWGRWLKEVMRQG
ncbi:hypothetical protein SBF1_110004 [Candidatus Desulfosporosinus infrequens]|uniref:Uncharacterized protein n=1 Tax=Candidatus Desulfosporosinus infrequens TaxID=2043169 RepID=A0A2U3JX07_9FIRM|nr:hypothetical protein SBF1_110004 [Candidatus Desulfosporosinus infrequens]